VERLETRDANGYLCSRGRIDLLDSVFCFRFRQALPLHVARIVSAAALQRHDVIDDVTRARTRLPSGGWTRVLKLKRAPRRRTPLDPTGGRPLYPGLVALFRSRSGLGRAGIERAGEK
jgi:hypothetical protein